MQVTTKREPLRFTNTVDERFRAPVEQILRYLRQQFETRQKIFVTPVYDEVLGSDDSPLFG
jgi:hypothetical protein